MKSPIEIMVEMKFLELGLIPPSLDLKKSLESMSPEDSRKAKRKFRKVQRKLKSRHKNAVNLRKSRSGWKKSKGSKWIPQQRKVRESMVREELNALDHKLGYYEEDPTLRQREIRRRLVRGEIWQNVKGVDRNHPFPPIFREDP